MTFEQFNREFPIDEIKERIIYSVINREAHRPLLAEIPSVDYLDLSIVFYVITDVDIKKGDMTTLLIRNEYLQEWNLTVEDLMNLASENTQRHLGLKINGILATIAEYMNSPEVKEIFGEGEDDSFPLYVASNEIGFKGAAVILYKNLLYALSAKLRSDLYIIPCSIHEVIILKPIKGYQCDTDSLRELISNVNSTELSAPDILSNNLYFYSKEKNEICIA